MSPDMAEEPSDRFITLMMRLRRLAPEQAAQISPSAMAIIDFVASEPYCGVKDVARGLEVSAPTVSVAVRQLEDAGLIARRAILTMVERCNFFLLPGDRRYMNRHIFPGDRCLNDY